MQRHIGYKILVSVVLCLLLAMTAVAYYAIGQQERSILAQNERTIHSLTESTAQSVKTIMLAGYADIAQSLADNLKTLPDVVDFRIVHRKGHEAFRNNDTINEVNERIGEEEFFPREEEAYIPLLDADQGPLREMLDSLDAVHYYENGADGEELLTFLAPIPNQKDCHRCHGSDHEVRGIVKLSTSLAPVRAQIQQTWQGLLVAIVLVSLLVTLAIGYLVRRISLPILAAAEEMDGIATGRGDLTVTLPVRGSDEVAKLSAGFNAFVSKIRDTVRQVAESSHSVGRVADQVSGISSDTRRSAETQQVATDGVRAAVTGMATTMESVGASTEAAMAQAREVDQLTDSGREEVEQTIIELRSLTANIQDAGSAVSSLAEGVEDISTVANLIESIADQTNLLALNASIEAARAGEYGRGFAVVADEVRGLAGRTRQSTGEIRGFVERLQTGSVSVSNLIQDSLRQANISVDQADRSGDLLQQITDAAHRILAINTSIAEAMTENTAAIESINDAVGGITAESRTTAQQADVAFQRSSELAEQVERLEKLVGQFRL